MRHNRLAAALALVLGGALISVLPATAAPPSGERGGGLEVYVGTVDAAGLEKLKLAGLDHEDIATGRGTDGRVAVEVVMSRTQAAKLAEDGVDLRVKIINGRPASKVAAAQNAAGYERFRSYSEAGGIRDELRATAAEHPDLAKLVRFGTTVNGEEMLAVKVTRQANVVRDGARPAVMYLGAQHAREWITPEMVRRLMHHYIDSYAKDAEITKILNTTELWFVPVANPDGYD
ncbi:MAG: M14 family zinc carboxypeptidase, partial [Nocardioidaceae bacterium]